MKPRVWWSPQANCWFASRMGEHGPVLPIAYKTWHSAICTALCWARRPA